MKIRYLKYRRIIFFVLIILLLGLCVYFRQNTEGFFSAQMGGGYFTEQAKQAIRDRCKTLSDNPNADVLTYNNTLAKINDINNITKEATDILSNNNGNLDEKPAMRLLLQMNGCHDIYTNGELRKKYTDAVKQVYNSNCSTNNSKYIYTAYDPSPLCNQIRIRQNR